MKKILAVGFLIWGVWALLMDNYAFAETTQNASFKLSVTIPEMPQLNSPLQARADNLNNLTPQASPNNDTIIEEALRGNEQVQLQTVVLK